MESTQINVKSLYNEHVKDLQTYIMFRIQQEVTRLTPELKAKNRDPISLSIGAPINNPPQAALNKLTEILTKPNISTYSVSKGEKVFLEAVAQRMKKRFNVDVDPATEITSLIGSKEGLGNLFRAFITPSLDDQEKDIILIPDPGYASYQEAIRVSGGLPVSIPLNEDNNYLPSIQIIENIMNQPAYAKGTVKILVINYPNNPIGATATLDYYQQLIDFGKKHNILICSDAAYVDLYFDDTPPPSILEVPGAKDIAIEMHTLSKPYAMTGWRVGFAVGNKEAIDILAKVKSTLDTGIFKALQEVCAFTLVSDECDEYIKLLNRQFKDNMEYMIREFKALGWPIDEYNVPKATFYLWLPIPKKYNNSSEFATDILKKSGIVIVPGIAFGNNGEGYFRISLVDKRERLETVISRMKEDGFTFS